MYIFLSNRSKPSNPTFQFDFNSLTFFNLAALLLLQRYFYFFCTTKAFLYCIIKRASLYIESINSDTVNNLVILIFNFLPTNVNSFVFISTIAFCCPPIKLIWFDYRIYSSQLIIPTINTS